MGSVADEMTIVSIPLAATCLGAIFKPLGSLTGKAVALMLNIANKRRGKKDSLEYREQSCDPAAKVDILVNCQHPKA